MAFAPGFTVNHRRLPAGTPIPCCKRWNIFKPPFRATSVHQWIFNFIFSIRF
jgi:hypothetical protein